MGYDVGASIMQGYKLNDFFEGHCGDELMFIYNVFEEYLENDDEKDCIPQGEQEGVSVWHPSYDDPEMYIGMSGSGGSVHNRGGDSESVFELLNLGVVGETVRRVLRKPNHPLFNMIADMMEGAAVKNYLLLSESY